VQSLRLARGGFIISSSSIVIVVMLIREVATVSVTTYLSDLFVYPTLSLLPKPDPKSLSKSAARNPMAESQNYEI
jgi:hypothetical protein